MMRLYASSARRATARATRRVRRRQPDAPRRPPFATQVFSILPSFPPYFTRFSGSAAQGNRRYVPAALLPSSDTAFFLSSFLSLSQDFLFISGAFWLLSVQGRQKVEGDRGFSLSV